MQKNRCLIFVVAYHAEATIEDVVQRVPVALCREYDVDILIIEDSSTDRTFERSRDLARRSGRPLQIHVLRNPTNQGYGGNQKLGYKFAIREGYDVVALVHGDGQYAPECLPALLKPIAEGLAAAVFGSRMLTPNGALSGGMPFYKYAGNKILTWLQNRILRSNLSEFHSGFRVYSARALEAIPFECNSNNFHFDTEIIIQLMIAQLPMVEVPIPTHYGSEISRVNALRYGFNVLRSTVQARLQELSLFYDRKYDCGPAPLSQYAPKFGFSSPHSFALNAVRTNSRVLDLGCGTGYVGFAIQEKKGCRVAGVDACPLRQRSPADFYLRDLNNGLEGIPVEEHDYVLLLDVIEHLATPETFLDELRRRLSLNPNAELIISTGNVAFFVTRMMLLLGSFNYGKRGILDLTHTRLFTFSSMLRVLGEAGFIVLETVPIPAPFPLALGDNPISRFLLTCNSLLARVSRGLFAYQMVIRVRARPTLEALLKAAEEESRTRSAALSAASAAQ